MTYEIAVDVALRRIRGENVTVIARDYGITAQMVYKIAKGRKWKGAHLTAAFLFDLEQEPDIAKVGTLAT